MTDGAVLWLVGRAVRLVLLLIGVAAVAFTLLSLSPIDPVRAFVGADMLRIGADQQAAIAAKWGLDAGPVDRFLAWVGALASGDAGTSMIYRQPVLTVIAERAPASLALMAGAWLLAGAMGLVLGVIAAAREGDWIDRAIQATALTLAATPTFWVGLLLIATVGLGLGLAPVCCAGPPGVPLSEVGWTVRLHHMVLPAIALAVPGLAQVTLHTRAKVRGLLDSDMALLAYAQGATRWRAAWRHGLTNGALPAVTVQFARFGELFGGTVLAETVFAYPGLGQATVAAGLRGDAPLLLAISLAAAVFVFVGNSIADLLAPALDPRQRQPRRRSGILSGRAPS